MTIWLHPWTDTPVYCALNGKLELRQDCASYQLVKSLYSIANGGFGGTGLGEGTFTSVDGTPLIPDLHTDFIFSAIAQELGLLGAAALLLVFMVLRRARDARRAPGARTGSRSCSRPVSRSASRCRRSSSSAASSGSCR